MEAGAWTSEQPWEGPRVAARVQARGVRLGSKPRPVVDMAYQDGCRNNADLGVLLQEELLDDIWKCTIGSARIASL